MTRNHRFAALAAGVTTLALALAGCGGSSSAPADGSPEKVELTVTTFGTMGFDKLYAQYEAAHPGVTVKATNIDTGDNALVDWKTKQAAGSGLPDVQAVEEGWLGQVMKVSTAFTDLREQGADGIKDRWVPWKLAQGTDPSGRIIGYGTDIGPEGLCYNRDLFKAAGLPTDRKDVAALFGGDQATWADFFKVGQQYKEKTGKAFYDQSGFVWNAMVNQQPQGYYTPDDKLNIEGNADPAGPVDPARDRRRPGPVGQPDPVGLGQGQGLRRRQLRHLRLPGLDARRGQGPGRLGRRQRQDRLGLRGRLPRRPGQLGRVVPDRAEDAASTPRRPPSWPTG